MNKDRTPEEIRSEAVAALRDLIRLERASDFGQEFAAAIRRLKQSGLSVNGTRLTPLTAEELGMDLWALAEDLAERSVGSLESLWLSTILDLLAPAHADLRRDFPWLPSIGTRPGWNPIIREMAERLEGVLGREALILGATARGPGPHPAEASKAPRLVGIKEKWGRLSTYLVNATPEAEAAVEDATAASMRTCEVCGGTGTLRRQGWVQTLCEGHALAYLRQAEAHRPAGSTDHRLAAARIRSAIDGEGSGPPPDEIDWVALFSPTSDLPAATSSPILRRGALATRKLGEGQTDE